jgi:hypothetical protein
MSDRTQQRSLDAIDHQRNSLIQLTIQSSSTTSQCISKFAFVIATSESESKQTSPCHTYYDARIPILQRKCLQQRYQRPPLALLALSVILLSDAIPTHVKKATLDNMRRVLRVVASVFRRKYLTAEYKGSIRPTICECDLRHPSHLLRL